jgi:aminocarboxymuconate-semialdehyde decarboxylase
MGGMVPYYAERIRQFTQIPRLVNLKVNFTREYIDYFKMFYADTALYGGTKALELGADFFGIDHIVFGVDFPLGDTEHGDRNYRQTINAIEAMGITYEDRQKIYVNNARKLMRLPV